ncbi:hypothetical protein JTE90_003586 [Oedothorax gibbosus]|uniref:Uncharacterized protein n=1 Tax=Oedothorax gibbosus TaxID=931172 RepID=A0AAV6VK77_9ARAC|nr:hypothetical protein JTE90_003586 [Oedothorax gibbosus]
MVHITDFLRILQRNCGCILISLALLSKPFASSQHQKSFSHHQSNSKSQIPWNILLDPNYTSHKKTSPLNHTFQPPYRHEGPPSDIFYANPHPGYKLVQEPAPQPPQYSYQYVPQMNNAFSMSEAKPNRVEYNSFSDSTLSRPVEKVMFPSNAQFQTKRPAVQKKQTSRPLTNHKETDSNTKRNEKKKNKKRKPSDYYESDEDDYPESLYDYDYPSPNERPPYNPPKKKTPYTKHKGDPLGLLPSASDPNGFFSKAKDILKGASFGRPSYSASSPDYYSQYPPYKQYGDPEQSYYSDDGYVPPGNSDYPPKTSYYGSPGYDYEGPIDPSSYGGIYPDKRKGSKYGPLAFALGLLPLGLLFASLVPTVVTIPVTTAVATGRRRKRSVEIINPALNIISSYGVSALEDPSCLNRIFCEVVRGGQKDTSSVVQKFYYKMAFVLDEKIAEFAGIKGLIAAVRNNKCDDFVCLSNHKMTAESHLSNSTTVKI